MIETLPHSQPQVTVQPGGLVRLAVFADDGRRSTTWNVWTSKHTLDVYMTARPHGSHWKVSLHETGSWHHGFTAEASLMAAGLPSRHLDRWQQPAEFGPGARHGFRLVIPDAELRRWPAGVTERRNPTVTRVPAPGAGNAAYIEFVIVAGDPPMLIDFVNPVFDIAALARTDGSAMRVVSRLVRWPREAEEWLRPYKSAALSAADPDMLRRAGAPRLMFLGTEADGTRFAVDSAADLESGGPMSDSC